VSKIKPTTLKLPIGTVNCYLMESDEGFVLVDTGGPKNQAVLERELANAGCLPGNLRLIVITHGDFDHIGTAAYLRTTFGAKIGMHPADAEMAEKGDMLSNRARPNILTRIVAPLVPLIFGFGKSERFTPDLPLEEGTDLSEYGLEATVLSLPGHSKGSIGILTADGDLLCGDLIENMSGPTLSSMMDDAAAANASVEKLKSLDIKTVYPGHGQPFPMEQFWNEYQQGASK
jgi:hydroxyacylglutathione hydrolase